jgi:asparagine synthase (glutamine-hydrolysing)
MVSRLAAESVTVVLSGDGGDELFGGYDKYVVEGRERRYGRMPAPIRWALRAGAAAMPEGMRGRNFLRHVSLGGHDRYLDATTLFRRAQQARLFTPEAFDLVSRHDPWAENRRWLGDPRLHWLSALQYSDLHTYLPLDILTKVDRMSMAHSIESRVPLLDHLVVEFAATIPPDLQIRRGVTKRVFKRALSGLVPDAILERPKHGFAVPLARWFRGRLGGFLRDVLLSSASRRRGILDPAYVEQLIARHDRGKDLDFQLWTLLSFELWCRRFLDAPPAPPSSVRQHRAERLRSVA